MKAGYLPLASVLAFTLRLAMCIFWGVRIQYYELCFSAVFVLLAYIAFLRLACCRNNNVLFVALGALIYVLSTVFRSIFPVRQESKSCYHMNGPPPWVDRFVALIGELALATQISFVIATVAHLGGIREAKYIFFGILALIAVAEVVCYFACLTHPSLHNIEYLIWLAVVFIVAVVSIYARNIRSKQLRWLSTVTTMVCLFTMYFFAFELEYYDAHMTATTDMTACHSTQDDDWLDYFSGYAYPYFVVFASISACLTLAIQRIRKFDDTATSWLQS